MLEECRLLLFDVSLQSTSSDGLQWLPDPIGDTEFVVFMICSLLRRTHPCVQTQI
jgi:hypothetical protein